MRIRSRTALFVCLAIVVSCEKNGDSEGACGAGYAEGKVGGFYTIYYLTLYTGTHSQIATYYNYPPGSPPDKVQFFVGDNIKGICINEHLKIDYKVKMRDVSQTLSMKISGDAYWSAFGDDIVLFNDIPAPGQSYSGSLNVGLKQAFPQGGGDVDAFVNVEFTSSGNFSVDSTYFVKHVRILNVKSKYSKF